MFKTSSYFFKNSFQRLVLQKCLRHTNGTNLAYVSGVSKNPLIPDTIGQRLVNAADLYGDREAFVVCHSQDRITFFQLKKKSEDLAAGLLALGFRKGDRLGIWAPNCIEWILTQYATALIGVIQVNINPAYKTSELEYALNKVQCKGMIMSETYKSQNYIQVLSDLCPELQRSKSGSLNSIRLPALKKIIVISDKKYNGCFSFKEILSAGDSHHRELINSRNITSSDTINIQYTSGTTGSPKGVMLSHHMILNNSYQVSMAQEYHLKKTIICMQVPLYHCFGMVLGSLASICHGITIVLPSLTFNPEESLKAIQNEKCTSVYGTPTMFIDLYNHPSFSQYDMSSLNAGIMSGSTCPPEVVRECVSKLNTNNMVVIYGQTETSPVITANCINDTLTNRTQTIGKPLEHIELKVLDQNMNIVKYDEPGELYVRGYNTMIGYWDDKSKTDEAYTNDRFFKTGDLVSMNEQGYLNFRGRLKDMVIRGGENIYPAEIENFLHSHPNIEDVYVVGVPDKRMGEELCACVKLRKGYELNANELRQYCKNKISHFKIPKYVEIVNEFPMTVTGKIKKNVLANIMRQKLKL